MARVRLAASEQGGVTQLAKLKRASRILTGLALAAGVLGGFVPAGTIQAATTATTYRDEVLADSPRAYWRLDETTGTTAADQLGVNPGAYTNGVLLNQPGALASEADPAASFDGVNDYVFMPASSSLDMTSAVTVEVWAKRRAISSTYQVLVGHPGDGLSKNENYAIWLNTTNVYQAYFGDGTTYASVSTPAVTDTNWHQIVATDDGASVKIYLDGVLKASKSTTLRLTANTKPLNLGRANNNQYFFNGWLDEVAIYPSALSATRIQAHYTKGTTDLIQPTVTLTQPADGSALASSNVSFGGTASSAPGDSSTVTVKVYSGTSPTGTPAQTLSATRQADNSYSVSATLAEGTWTAQSEQQDTAGNIGKSSAPTFTVSTAAPTTTITGPPDPSNETTATFNFFANKPASFQCKLDGGAFASCSSPQGYSNLADGSHTFQVKATDTAGNTSTASYPWTVDTVAPPRPTITSNPPSQTTSTSATFGFADAETGVTFLCQLGGGGFSTCSSPQSYSGLTSGVHTFDVKASDAAGNESTLASYTWTVGATAIPAPTFSATPPDPSTLTSASFSFSDSQADVTFECSLDGASYDACTSPASLSGLADGSHTFRVRARDSGGNFSAAQSYTWTVDTTAPAETITSKPPNPSNSTTSSFSFTASETASFECSLDGADFASCSSPQGYSGLAEGSHTFQLRATDQAGNISTTSYTWIVDTTAPSTTITSKPPNPSNSAAASFSFTASETASFECSLDGVAFASCSSPQGYSGLADGSHTFRVRATDQAGNTGQTASFGWTITTAAPPTPTITANPSSLTTATSATFSFSDAQSGVTLLCQIDGGGFTTCTSPRGYSGLADGSHTFDVKARDASGNESAPASYTWTVDTTSPITTVASTPSNPSSQPTATFGFFANESSTFQCKLDGGAFSACSSPQSYSGLADGSHTFQVKATDQAGNVGLVASYPWTVDTRPPTITLTSPANGDARAEWPTFRGGAGTAAGDSSTVTVNLYSGAAPNGSPLQTLTASAGSGPYSVIAASPLNPGTYTAQAQQTDTAGNVGSSSANTFTVGDPVVLAAGDIAYCLTDGASRTAPLLSREPDALVLPLGDNAYVNGQPSEYQNCYDPTWGVAKTRTRPVIGPHDEGVVSGGPPAGTGYLNYFADQLAPFAPTANDPSKLYYSYDLGSWHVVVLNDSCIEGYTPNCNEPAQEQWLTNDLAAHTNQCTLVAQHEPRWSSDSVHGNRPQIGAFWNILYRYGVDLVLNGSAHDYERFAPQDAAGNLDTSYGIREIVVGTGGDFTYPIGTLKPNSEVYSSSSYGVLRLALHPGSYDWQFLPVADGRDPNGGSFTDSGSTSCHGAPSPNLTVPSVRAVSSNAANAATLLPLNKPTGAAQGDLLLAIVSHQSGNQRSIAPPSGWTAVPNTDYKDGSNVRIHAYYRIAGATEPASYTFTLTGGSGQDMAGGILDVTGASVNAPINASGGQTNGGPASKSVPAPSITATVANALYIYSGAANVAATFTPPGQMIEQWDLATSGTFKVCNDSATMTLANAGPTGTQTAFLSTSGRSVAIAIAIAPAP